MRCCGIYYIVFEKGSQKKEYTLPVTDPIGNYGITSEDIHVMMGPT
jgi:hypothetical protein